MQTTKTEPEWLDLQQARKLLSPLEKDWITNTDSLTYRLRDKNPAAFQVNLLSQQWQIPYPSETALLKLVEDEIANVRQIQLSCNDQICIWARSVFPKSSLQGPNQRLLNLNTQSLGDVLASDPNLKRAPFQVARLTTAQQDYHDATQHLSSNPQFIWCRRSLFTLFGQLILVNEAFMPHLFTETST